MKETVDFWKFNTHRGEELKRKKHFIDKLNISNHKDSWCLANCDPYKERELDGVNTAQEKKSAIKSPNISNLFRQRSGYISDFTLISPEKNLADFRGFNSTNPLSF